MIEHPLFGNLIESEALLPMRTFAANAVRLQRSAACGVEEAGRAVGRQILMVKAQMSENSVPHSTTLQAGAGALGLVRGGALFLSQRRQLVAPPPATRCPQAM
jgi:hypothetical protein